LSSGIIAARVIVVMMCVDHVLHRLVAKHFDLRHDGVVVALVHVVDQDDALVGDVHGDVAALALDHVEVVLDLLRGRRTRRRGLGVGEADAEDCRQGGEQAYLQRAVHLPNNTKRRARNGDDRVFA